MGTKRNGDDGGADGIGHGELATVGAVLEDTPSAVGVLMITLQALVPKGPPRGKKPKVKAHNPAEADAALARAVGFGLSTPSSTTHLAQPQSCVKLVEAYAWPRFCLSQLNEHLDKTCTRDMVRDLRAGTTISTSFSGVESPGTAANMIIDSLRQMHNTDMPPIYILHNIEIDAEKQAELLLHPSWAGAGHIEPCLFGDINDFFVDELADTIKYLLKNPGLAMTILAPLVKKGKAMKARRHNQECTLKTATGHLAGTPCVAFSARGKELGECDKTIVAFLAWCGLRRLLEEPVVVQENVEAFPIDLVEEMLADLYSLESVVVSPLQLGWPVSRDRRWTCLRHRT